MSAMPGSTARPTIMNRAGCLHGLIVRIATGDRSAFRQLYDHSATAIFSIALKATGDQASAEILTLNVFVAMWQRSSEFDPGALSPVEWILSLVGSRVTEHIERTVGAPGRLTEPAPVLATTTR